MLLHRPADVEHGKEGPMNALTTVPAPTNSPRLRSRCQKYTPEGGRAEHKAESTARQSGPGKALALLFIVGRALRDWWAGHGP